MEKPVKVVCTMLSGRILQDPFVGYPAGGLIDLWKDQTRHNAMLEYESGDPDLIIPSRLGLMHKLL